MKILTWNINGIRASKRCLKDVLDSLDADVICLQETKITRDMLDEPSAIVEGYNAYFSFSRKRSGYSGTVNFCKDAVTPCGGEEGLAGQFNSQSEGSVGCVGNVEQFDGEELRSLDGEGRAILTEHQIKLGDEGLKKLVVINVYVPRAAERDERLTYKLHFLALLQSRAESLLRRGRHVIVVGDLNLTHKDIDHCDPTTQEFLRPDSRQWLDQFLRPEDRDPDLAPVDDPSSFEATLSDAEGGHFVDAFRFFHPEQTEAYTNWCTVTAARQTNYGKRLDYILVDQGLQDYLEDCHILADYEGSDHCPVVVQLRCQPRPASKCPPLCTKWMPEFQGKQQKLLHFFSTRKPAPKTEEASGRDKEENVPNSQLQSPAADGESQRSPPLVKCPSSSLTPWYEKGNNERKSPQKAALKRVSTENALDNRAKKKKGKGEKSNAAAGPGGGSRQGSLLNFFHKPPGSASKDPANLAPANSDKPTSACQTHGAKQTKSRYWEQESEGDGQLMHISTDSPGSGSPKTSPTKLSLPSLTLTPCSSSQTSSSSADSSDPGTASAADAENGASGGTEATEGSNLEAPNTQAKAKCVWKNLLSGPPPAPPCKGHGEPCVLRTVKKAGPTRGRQFYVCARPEGHSTNKEARCDYFQWVNHLASKKKP